MRAQQGALARPAAAEQGHELAASDGQVDATKYVMFVERTVQLVDADDGFGRRGGHVQRPENVRRHDSSLLSSSRTNASDRRPMMPYTASTTTILSVS